MRGDARRIPLRDNSVHCAVTSPPYWGLRDYGIAGQLGAERTPQEYVSAIVGVCEEIRRVLRPDGTLWLNVGDSYASAAACHRVSRVGLGSPPLRVRANMLTGSLKEKDLSLVPERLAIALQDAGWYVRSRIAWAKTAPMPEAVRDRPTSAWEHIWLLSKSRLYYFDAEAVREPETSDRPSGNGYKRGVRLSYGGDEDRGSDKPWLPTGAGRNLRNFWLLGPEPYRGAHFATFPTEIPRRAILAGTSAHGVCAECGAPWRRVVERSGGNWKERKAAGGPARYGMNNNKGRTALDYGGPVAVATLGWRPGCECGAGVVPATVLDPFAGSGTTVSVARELGRVGIGIELNPGYIVLAERRIAATPVPLFPVDSITAAG